MIENMLLDVAFSMHLIIDDQYKGVLIMWVSTVFANEWIAVN